MDEVSWGVLGELPGRPRGSREASREASQGGPEGPGEALEASWMPLGAPKPGWSAKAGASRGECGAPGAEKSSLDRVLAAPRPIPREVSAILDVKRFPKGRPRGPKIESKGPLKLKMRILIKVLFFNIIH